VRDVLGQLQDLIEAARRARGERDRPRVSQSSVRACRAALDIMLPAMSMDADPRVRTLAMQAWQETRDLGKQATARLAQHLEQHPL